MKLVKFYKSNKYQNHYIIVVASTSAKVDEVTGVAYTSVDVRHYIFVGYASFKQYMNKEVSLTLVKSPKLGFEVCTAISCVEQPKEQLAL